MRIVFLGIMCALIACGAACRGARVGLGATRIEPAKAAPAPDGARAARWTAFGHSMERRPLMATTVGTGVLRVYVIGGIHGNETEGLVGAARIAAMPAAELTGATVRVVQDANPDGTVSRKRGNARGLDLNRNWPATNFSRASSRGESALSAPESQSLFRDIEAFAPHVIVVFHSIASGPFVNFDGPAGELALAFASAARRRDARWRVVPQMGYGTPGSLGSYFGVDRGIPILTIEFKRGQDSESAAVAAVAGLKGLIEPRPSVTLLDTPSLPRLSSPSPPASSGSLPLLR